MNWSIYVLLAVMALVFLFLVLVKPGRPRDSGMDAIYAHRGYHDDERPENSLAAFANARVHGLGAELDVQLTRDRKLVVFHDKNLRRMTGADRDLCSTDYEDLASYPLSGTDQRIPLFSDVLKTLNGMPVICEVKTYNGNSNCEIMPELCRQIDGYSGRIAVESFSPFILRWLKKNRPDIIRGQLSQNFLKHGGLSGVQAVLLGNLLTNFMARPDFIAYNFNDSSPGLSATRLFGPSMAAWTIRSRDELERAAADGYETFICENFDIEHALSCDDGDDAE